MADSKSVIARFFPLVFFILLLGGLYYVMHHEGISKVEDKPFAAFKMQDIRENALPQDVSLETLKGKVHIVHLWATWCGTCLEEHEAWLNFHKKHPQYSLVGIAYRDSSQKVLSFIKEKGDPFTSLLSDTSGELGIALGIEGVPKTLIVDKKGMIRYQVLGSLSDAEFNEELLPFIKELENESA